MKIEKQRGTQCLGDLGWLTHHKKAVQGFLPLLGTNVCNSSVVKMPQKVQWGKPGCYRINAKYLLIVHEPGPEAIAFCYKAALATSGIGRRNAWNHYIIRTCVVCYRETRYLARST